MTKQDGQVAAGVGSVYERFFVPALFGEWAPRLVHKSGIVSGQRALDVACGTGVVTRELCRVLGPSQVRALDLNAQMLDIARSLAPEVEFTQGRAEELPYDSESFNAVFCQFGVMFFDPPESALREMMRVLAPGGVLVVAAWASLEQTPGYAAMAQLLERLFGADIAAHLHAPFKYGDSKELEELLTSAGIRNADIETIVGTAHFPSIEAWVHTEIRGWTLAEHIDDAQYERLLTAAQAELGGFVSNGRVTFDSPAHIVTAGKG